MRMGGKEEQNRGNFGVGGIFTSIILPQHSETLLTTFKNYSHDGSGSFIPIALLEASRFLSSILDQKQGNGY